jgi:predicted AlkP superfamily phosphohydrolase/phosphomutase
MPGLRVPRMNPSARSLTLALGVVLLVFLRATEAAAYIGPGAGFAFLTSFFLLFTSLLFSCFVLLTWPIRALLRWCKRRKAYARGAVERVVILGLDGLDPDLCEQFMAEGRLPHLARLRAEGSFARLQTTCPPISPVAWSSFSTGVNPGRHGIYDFLSRDPRTYLPKLSSTEIGQTSRHITLGRYTIPLGRPRCKLLRKSQPFWKVLGEHGIFSTILRVPITFPPERFHGVLLSGMCVPDLKGTQGTFTWYTTHPDAPGEQTGGTRIRVALEGTRIHASIPGPLNPFSSRGEELRVPFSLTLDREADAAVLEVGGERVRLQRGTYSEWVSLRFRAGLGMRVHGIARFLLTQVSPHVELYLSPVNIDPEKPALPISHPVVYSIYLAKALGKYATLGLAEDTWALNERVLDEEAFLAQCELTHAEREQMLFHALARTRRGLCVCVFDITDRVQHMFFRYLDGRHPAAPGTGSTQYQHVIRDLYGRMDELVGRVRAALDERTVLMVMSDHGFKSFRRGVSLNAWLHRNGYLVLKAGAEGRQWLQGVDWEKTRAYALGLGGLYVNLKGRESQGIVDPGGELEALKREIARKLTGLKDDETGEVAIREVFDAATIYHGPYRDRAPDFIVGYNEGYRASWESVIGKVTGRVFEENHKSWSGDHCIDPRLVPGVFFCNRALGVDHPAIVDLAPTVLKLFGVDVPSYMDGKPLIAEDGKPQ